MPVGTILPFVGILTDIPNKWALCDGTNGTPDLRGRFLEAWGSDGYTTLSIGQFLDPGLPNITGGFTGAIDVWGSGWGAFYFSSSGQTGQNQSDNDNPRVEFNASRCSAIYGNSNTVQPRSYVVYYIMKIQK